MILAYGSKREILSCWLPLFCRFSDERALLQSQVQYKICSTWLYPCLQVFRGIDLKGYPMSLSHSQPLTGQSIQSNLMKFSSLNRNERPGSWLISFSLTQRPHAKMTTVIRACTQITQPNTWVTVFLWLLEFPNYLAGLSGGLAPQPGPFLIPFHVCFCEWGEIQTQVRVESKLLFMAQLTLMLPSKFTVFFWALLYLVQVSCLPHKETSLRAIRLHLQAIRKVSDTYFKSYFWMSGSTLFSWNSLHGFLWLQSNSHWLPQERDQAFSGACQNRKAECSAMYASGELQ